MIHSKKLPQNVSVSLKSNLDFDNRFMSSVWNSESFDIFELRCKIIHNDFKLGEDNWLSKMYDT